MGTTAKPQSPDVKVEAIKIERLQGFVAAQLSSETENQICGLLGVQDSDRRAGLIGVLRHIAATHAAGSHFIAKHADAKAPRRDLKKLTKALAQVEECFEVLPPGTHQQFDFMLKDKWPDLDLRSIGLRRDCNYLREVAASLLETSKTRMGRPAETALLVLVGTLSLLCLKVSGNRPRFSTTRDGNKEPRFSSAEAKAIHAFVRDVEPDCSSTTLINQLLKIRRNFAGAKLSQAFGATLVPLKVTGYIRADGTIEKVAH